MDNFKTSALEHSIIIPTSLNSIIINCSSVTFSLKELNIDLPLDESNLRKCLDNTDTLVINGTKFVKAGSEKR